MDYHFEEKFEQINFSENQNIAGEYENCEFLSCDLNGLDLSDIKFIQCQFIECNLSNSSLENTSFQQVEFINCKMIGFNLENSNKFGLSISFENCTLNDSSFYELPLKKTKFSNCSLQNVEFSFADLSQAYFMNCNLAHAIFYQTNLKQANFKTAYNFTINPNDNELKGAQFSKENCIALLDYLGIKID
ncbi:pentapeptide repeat-containing protein [Empedobacter sp. UBA7248]|uniref:pentapeptide repeat-containing protein n=1 Tax=Empedobacter sp. UBA7248 TaxID=1946448 RepID=UPI0025BB5074|nr:pentapeptide repeat-containing protein [Empedobacter sp. UBA7248]